jgi:ubiquinone/menaquinone biosynthesis C-methylase UbiE
MRAKLGRSTIETFFTPFENEVAYIGGAALELGATPQLHDVYIMYVNFRAISTKKTFLQKYLRFCVKNNVIIIFLPKHVCMLGSKSAFLQIKTKNKQN